MEYRWLQEHEPESGELQLQLRMNDAEEMLVARFHHKHTFPAFSPNRPLAALEVLDGFEKMVDEILVSSLLFFSFVFWLDAGAVQVTFIYVDNRGGRKGS